jgi:L-ascorbate metabolism protein UlaG (beta-lactamase superfamily)
VLLGLFALTIVVAAWSAWSNVGDRPDGTWLARDRQSPQWHGDRFANPLRMFSNLHGGILQMLRSRPGEEPDAPVATVNASAQYRQAPASGLRVTWFGHSSSLVEIDGVHVLIDPIWSERASPFAWLGPRRFYPPAIPLDALPRIDVVVVSHDHYDHLDRATIQALDDRGVRFVVPLGIGAELAGWGVDPRRIVELDWWQEARVGDVRIIATPSRHASGRLSPQSDHTLWAGYAFVGSHHRVFYSGDTGMNDTFVDVGRRFGPFDVALVESGQYDAQWPDWHLGPEQAVAVSGQVGARLMIPVHWGLFKLAHHAWTEPPERVLAAARCTGTRVMVPAPGQPVEPATQAPIAHWWPRQAWATASEHPIVATRDGDPRHTFALPPCMAASSANLPRAATP